MKHESKKDKKLKDVGLGSIEYMFYEGAPVFEEESKEKTKPKSQKKK